MSATFKHILEKCKDIIPTETWDYTQILLEKCKQFEKLANCMDQIENVMSHKDIISKITMDALIKEQQELRLKFHIMFDDINKEKTEFEIKMKQNQTQTVNPEPTLENKI